MLTQLLRIVNSFSIVLSHIISINMLIHQPYRPILALILTLSDPSFVENVQVSEFISDYTLVLSQPNFIDPSLTWSKNVTFWRYHKIKIDNSRSNLANCSFVKCPGDTASAL